MALWTTGILLVLGLAWFVGAVVVPVWQVRRAVGRFNSMNGAEVVEMLGGKERARKWLIRCLYWPDWVAPDKASAAEVLSQCPDGREAIAAILRDLQAPADARVAVADYQGREWENDMDGVDWKTPLLAGALDDPSAPVRVAAARSILGPLICISNERDAAAKQLAACLGDEDVRVRRTAAAAAANAGTWVEGSSAAKDFFSIAEPALEAALKDPDPEVRGSAAEALRHKPKPVRRYSGEEKSKAE